MNNHRKIQIAMLSILLIFVGRNERVNAWFWALPVFWQVMVVMGGFAVTILILLRSLGFVAFF